jgi:hypothetical protein
MLEDIQAAPSDYAGLSDVRLVDAQSFCWLLVRPELERSYVLVLNSAKGRETNAKIYDGRDIAIENMINMTVQTVKYAIRQWSKGRSHEKAEGAFLVRGRAADGAR